MRHLASHLRGALLRERRTVLQRDIASEILHAQTLTTLQRENSPQW